MPQILAQLLAPPRGAHARPWYWRAARPALILALAAAVLATAGAAANPRTIRHPATRPACVAWHSCACRYPSHGHHYPGNNHLCAVTWGRS